MRLLGYHERDRLLRPDVSLRPVDEACLVQFVEERLATVNVDERGLAEPAHDGEHRTIRDPVVTEADVRGDERPPGLEEVEKDVEHVATIGDEVEDGVRPDDVEVLARERARAVERALVKGDVA